jgi:hypothetical protein
MVRFARTGFDRCDRFCDGAVTCAVQNRTPNRLSVNTRAPIFDILAMITRDELLDQTADETPRCVIVRMPTPPSAGTLLARMRHRATQLAHS